MNAIGYGSSMADTDTETLEQLKLCRDKVIADILAGKNVTSLTIGSKTSDFPSSNATLDMIEKLISRYTSKSSTGSARTRARIKR